MSLNFLDFEQPIAELEAKIDSLTAVSRQDEKQIGRASCRERVSSPV